MTQPRPLRRRLALVPFMYKRWLLSGKPGALIYLEPKRVQALWDAFGAIITARHLRRWPGSRPANWHRFSAPERWDSAAETQFQFLQRLDLLQPQEKARVRHQPRLTAPAKISHPLSPLATGAWQLVLIDDRVELVRVGPHAGTKRP
jgi:hypothetical protein